jgi:lariat debranching enzyme
LFKLKPKYWFSAHLHVKFSAVVYHEESTTSIENPDEINIDLNEDLSNPDEINMDLEDDINQEERSNNKDSQNEKTLKDYTNEIPYTKFLALDKCLPERDFLQVNNYPKVVYFEIKFYT